MTKSPHWSFRPTCSRTLQGWVATAIASSSKGYTCGATRAVALSLKASWARWGTMCNMYKCTQLCTCWSMTFAATYDEVWYLDIWNLWSRCNKLEVIERTCSCTTTEANTCIQPMTLIHILEQHCGVPSWLASAYWHHAPLLAGGVYWRTGKHPALPGSHWSQCHATHLCCDGTQAK